MCIRDRISIVGRIHTRTYDNPEGKRTYVTEVIVESVNFLDRKRINDTPESSLETDTAPILWMNVKFSQI